VHLNRINVLIKKEKSMQSQTKVFLDFSEEVEEIFQQQHIDIYQAIEEELPEVHLSALSDPQAQRGEKDLITVIIVTSPAIILAITPIVIRVLNQFRPDTTEVRTEEIETHQDGSTIHRISISLQRQHNQQAKIPSPQQASLEPPQK